MKGKHPSIIYDTSRVENEQCCRGGVCVTYIGIFVDFYRYPDFKNVFVRGIGNKLIPCQILEDFKGFSHI